MKVDHALILAAGKGTRMGEIGQIIPKVIWPIFEKSILELEVLYAKKLGVKKIHTNLYHYKNKVLKYLLNKPLFDDVNIIEEDAVLDIGGAVHNLASQLDYKGTLLILNSDQFIMLNKETSRQAKQMLLDSDMLLFTYNVNSDQMYNKLEIDNERGLLSIIENHKLDRNTEHETYTGMAIIKLESLEPCLGASKFFSTVANPKLQKIKCLNISDADYWDFGTINRYHESMFNILDKLESEEPFIKFLLETNAVNKSKQVGNSYFTDSNNTINLSNQKVKLGNRSILLKSIKDNFDYGEQYSNVVIYENVIQKLS